jgi:hypothetical protein
MIKEMNSNMKLGMQMNSEEGPSMKRPVSSKSLITGDSLMQMRNKLELP